MAPPPPPPGCVGPVILTLVFMAVFDLNPFCNCESFDGFFFEVIVAKKGQTCIFCVETLAPCGRLNIFILISFSNGF